MLQNNDLFSGLGIDTTTTKKTSTKKHTTKKLKSKLPYVIQKINGSWQAESSLNDSQQNDYQITTKKIGRNIISVAIKVEYSANNVMATMTDQDINNRIFLYNKQGKATKRNIENIHIASLAEFEEKARIGTLQPIENINENDGLIQDLEFEPVQETAEDREVSEPGQEVEKKLELNAETATYQDIFTELEILEKLRKKAKIDKAKKFVKVFAPFKIYKVIKERLAIFGGVYKKKYQAIQFPYDPSFLMAILSSGQSVLKMIDSYKENGELIEETPNYLKVIAENIKLSNNEAPTAAEETEIYYPHLDKIVKDQEMKISVEKETAETPSNEENLGMFDRNKQNECFQYFKKYIKDKFGSFHFAWKQDFNIEFEESDAFWNNDLTIFDADLYLTRILKYNSFEAYQNDPELRLERA